MADFEELAEQYRAAPVETTLDAVLLVGGLLLSVATFAVLLGGIARGSRALWIGVVLLAVFLVSVANVFYPLWNRYRSRSDDAE